MVDLSTFKRQPHREASILKLVLWIIASAIFFRTSWFVFVKFKIMILRLFGAKVGEGLIMYPSVQIKYPWKLIIGNNCWLGENVWIDNLDMVTIGNNVCVSQGAYLLTGNHNYNTTDFALLNAPIYLEDGVWIGAKTVVCPGVRCNKLSVLTVNSVATKDLHESGIYQGNPAKLIRQRKI